MEMMGYTSNDTEKISYLDQYCRKCGHWKREDDGEYSCPIMEVLVLGSLAISLNDEQLPNRNDTDAERDLKETIKRMLSILSPMEDGTCGECRFYERK